MLKFKWTKEGPISEVIHDDKSRDKVLWHIWAVRENGSAVHAAFVWKYESEYGGPNYIAWWSTDTGFQEGFLISNRDLGIAKQQTSVLVKRLFTKMESFFSNNES